MSRYCIFATLSVFVHSLSFSQETDAPFPPSDASAVYLNDHGKFYWDFQDGDLSTNFERRYQIHLLDNEAVRDLSRIIVRYLSKDDLEVLDTMAVSVSKPDTTASPPDSLFNEYLFDGVWTERSVALEDLSPGDTVNVFYRIKASPSRDIQTWTYQQNYPVLKSRFSVMVPEFTVCTDFIDLGQEKLIQKHSIDTTLIWGRYQIRSAVYKYQLSDLESAREEPYAPSMQIQKIKHIFCFTAIHFSQEYSWLLPDWRTQCVDLIDNSYWGRQFKSSSNYRWLEREARGLLDQPYSDRLMAHKLYSFVNESFQWNGSFGLFPEQSLREMHSSRYNNRSGLNIALLALCRSAKLKAFPVLFATRNLGEVYNEIPNIDQFDHMVVAVLLDKDTFYMDAGDNELSPGLLHPDVLNDKGLYIRKYKINWVRPDPGYAESNMLVNLKMDKSLLAGDLSVKMDGYDSYQERIMISQDRRATHWKERMKQLHPSIQIDSILFKNVERVYQPLELAVYFHFEGISMPDTLEIIPGFYSFFSYNPFRPGKRISPIVFPFQIAEDLVINYLIPDHMTTSITDPKRYKINDSVQMEIYSSTSGPYHQVRYRVFVDQLTFDPEQYEAIQEFFMRVQDDILTPVRYFPVPD
jgi:hypothetical protein